MLCSGKRALFQRFHAPDRYLTVRDQDVPQEGNATLGGRHKAVYARGPDGQVKLFASAGWEVEEIVTRQAVDEYARLAEEARRKALVGTVSPLLYHMYSARMDVTLLAQCTHLWVWRIRRHFRPDVFRGLSPATLRRYADALGCSVDQLTRVDQAAP